MNEHWMKQTDSSIWPPDGGDMLADGEVDALNERRVDLPAMCRQHLLDCPEGTEDDAVLHVDQTPAPHRLDHLRIEQLGQGHPARLGHRACGLAALRLHPGAAMAQQAAPGKFEAERLAPTAQQ